MVQQSFSRDLGSNILAQVRQGMAVYDAMNKKVGTVDDLYLGASSEKLNQEGEGAATAPSRTSQKDTLVRDIAKVFAPNDMPEVLRDRLLRSGFIRIHTGLLGGHLYALPEQVTSVSGDRIQLNVNRDRLIKSSYNEDEAPNA